MKSADNLFDKHRARFKQVYSDKASLTALEIIGIINDCATRWQSNWDDQARTSLLIKEFNLKERNILVDITIS